MGRVSRSPKNKYLEKQLSPTLWYAFSWLTKKGRLKEFLPEFMTPEERLMLAKRLAILYLLHRGFHYREIASLLGMSNATVNYWKHQLDGHKGEFLPLLRELDNLDLFAEKSEEKDGEFWLFISDLLSARTDMRARARLYERAAGKRG